MNRRRFLASAMAAFPTLSLAGGCFGQDFYPTRPVKLISTDPPGTGVDIATRVYADRLSALLKQQFVVENKAGGIGLVAAKAAMGAPADGYTLLAAAASTFTIMPTRRENNDLDLNRSLIPIGLLGQLPQIIAISPKAGINSLKELIDAARKEPERLLCGTNGAGTFPHLTAKRFVDVAQAPITIVPYASGGTNEVTRDILGGRVQMVVTGLSAVLGLIQSGDLKLLATATEKRLARYPDVPTVSETIPGFTAVGWSVLVAPAGTPDGVVQLLHRTINDIAGEAAVRSKLEDMGTFPLSMSLRETRAFIEAEQRTWHPIAKSVGG